MKTNHNRATTNPVCSTTMNRIKKLGIGMLLLGLSLNSVAQQRSLRDSVIEEKLVELALRGPQVRAGEHQAKINEYELKRRQQAYLNLLTLSLNYNDQSFARNVNQTVVFPKYFFGLNIPLGTLLSRTEVKSARESIEIGKNNQEQLRRQLRAEVIAQYRQYRAHSELINIQTELVSDMESTLTQQEDKFRKGAISLEAYNAAQRNLNDERAKLINLRLRQDIIKVELERLIGQPLETVTR
jgi:outer membrane protein TolC